MFNREGFLKTYNCTVQQVKVASAEEPLVGAVSPVRLRPSSGCFFDDARNLGGDHIIRERQKSHREALKRVTSVIASDLRPPHAHISNVVGDKTEFAHDKKRRRRSKKPFTLNTILLRRKRNIDPELHQLECFVEVREAFRKVQEIVSGRSYQHQGNSVDNKQPSSFKLAKKINANRRPNQYAITEHVKNLASLSRRLNSINNLQMRRKNPFDPLVNPIRVRRPGEVP